VISLWKKIFSGGTLIMPNYLLRSKLVVLAYQKYSWNVILTTPDDPILGTLMCRCTINEEKNIWTTLSQDDNLTDYNSKKIYEIGNTAQEVINPEYRGVIGVYDRTNLDHLNSIIKAIYQTFLHKDKPCKEVVLMSVKLRKVENDILISGYSPEQVYNAAKDNVEYYHKYMKEVEKVEIIETGEDSKTENEYFTLEWTTTPEGKKGAVIIWTQKNIYHGEIKDGSYLITWELVEGDLDRFEGEWKFISEANGTKVSLLINYCFGIPAIEHLINKKLDEQVRKNAKMLLEGLEKIMKGVKQK
jgi:ribosome-associated toxin RatA of RatAB toxin-antitoxin module